MNVEDLEKITAQMDDLDVPSEDRMMVITPEGWERLLWSQAPWWKKILSKIAPGLLPHEWRASRDSDGIEYRHGTFYNYLVCQRCGSVTDSFRILEKEEFLKRYRRCGCLGRKKRGADRN